MLKKEAATLVAASFDYFVFNLPQIQVTLKNLSLVFNVVLLLLVGVLFYFHFKEAAAPHPIEIAPSSKDSLVLKPLKVAYVDLDSIEEKFYYFKQKQTDFERKKENADKDLNNSYMAIEKERAQFAQRGNAITQTEAENFQKEYTGKMQDLQREKESKQQEFLEEQQKIMDDVQSKLNTFLDEYNKTKHYSFIFTTGKGSLLLFYKDPAYNITDEVLTGLNASIKVGQ